MSEEEGGEDMCSYEAIMAVAKTEICTWLNKNCKSQDVFNFYKLRYCRLDDNWLGSILFLISCILLIVVAFYILGKIAQIYLTPVLTKISNALRMSETLSGVTLLAFANGAPDIISAAAAAESDGGIYITIGNLYGAGLFCATLVLARCIQVSPKPIRMQPNQWNRDIVFYIITSCVLLIYALISYITIWMAIVFFLIYGVYITIVLYQDRQQTNAENSLNDSFMAKTEEEKREVSKTKLTNQVDQLIVKGEQAGDSASGKKGDHLAITTTEAKHIVAHEFQHQATIKDEAGEQETQADKVLKVVTLPLRILPMLTVPNIGEDDVDSWWIFVTPTTAAFIACYFGSGLQFEKEWFGVNTYFIVVPIGVICSGIVFYLKNRGSRNFEWILVPFALVASILWLKTAATVIVDLIEFISTIYGINKVLLGATVLGIGNTLADFFANSSLSLLGYGVMACTGSIAGQLFNLLISLPLNIFNGMRLQKPATDRTEFRLLDLDGEGKEDKVFAMLIIFLVISQLIFLMYTSIFNKFELTKSLAIKNLGIYIASYVFLVLLKIIFYR